MFALLTSEALEIYNQVCALIVADLHASFIGNRLYVPSHGSCA